MRLQSTCSTLNGRTLRTFTVGTRRKAGAQMESSRTELQSRQKQQQIFLAQGNGAHSLHHIAPRPSHAWSSKVHSRLFSLRSKTSLPNSARHFPHPFASMRKIGQLRTHLPHATHRRGSDECCRIAHVNSSGETTIKWGHSARRQRAEGKLQNSTCDIE